MIKIKLKLFASLMDYLPAGSNGHEAELLIEEGSTPMDIAESLKIPSRVVHLVLIDGHTLNHKDIASRKMKDGETISIFPAISGG